MATSADSHPLRIGDAERGEAIRFLGDHYSQGRLTMAEFEDRSESATAARTRSDLIALFADLPGDHRITDDFHVGTPNSSQSLRESEVRDGDNRPAAGLGPALEPIIRSAGELAESVGRSVNRAVNQRVAPAQGESSRYRVLAGVLQIFPSFGAGRFYTGHIGMGIAQFCLSFAIVGLVWSFVDGVLLLAHGGEDAEHRSLR
ncbi:DUF1707 domain-containing protein [Actinoalloteichus hymeniacidonis]|uniref:DUF1707 family protein n=1 Tax=Actinoalloteichus hymeniacidonis TaxID=340345 RepID=A0AAC9MZT9_9PSEU|nr:DUF1707 domain-containing protein [Actinoalloteichus hymeniacidonis]AOS64397.1 putative DUF1707 family protein [Actinoalloteichus hymeniacidonis]MBB5907535.1 hypothetical protein [Actinoalloteichus hymeniacidonis]